MKTFMKILLGLAIAGAGIVGLVFFLTADLPKAADAFFTRIAANDYDGALALTTPDFRASTDRAGLEAFARSNGLNSYKSASWSSRAMNNGVGNLEGELTVAGGVVPVTVTLVKGDSGWQIQNVKKADAGVATDSKPAKPAETMPAATPAAAESAPASAAPDAATQQALVAATLQAFAESVNGDDFTPLHDTAFSKFQEQISVDNLHEQFAAFVEQEVDLSGLESMTPTLDSASGLSADGTLRLVGSYDTQPAHTNFDLGYAEEDGEWRLVSINVKVGK